MRRESSQGSDESVRTVLEREGNGSARIKAYRVSGCGRFRGGKANRSGIGDPDGVEDATRGASQYTRAKEARPNVGRGVIRYR